MQKPVSGQQPAVLLENAAMHFRNGNLEAAERLCREALQLDPVHAEALFRLGIIKARAGDLAAAAEALSAAESANPESVETRVILGHVLMDSGKPQEALSAYERALAVNDGVAEALYGQGNALQALGRSEAAVECYSRALAIVADSPEILTNRGNALHDLGRFGEALADYDRALSLAPGVAMLHNNRGNSLRELKRHAEALSSLDRALELEPRYVEARINRGNVLHDLKRYPEALSEFEQVLQSNPRLALAHRLRAGVLHDLNRREASASAYRIALQIDPEDPETLCNFAILLYELAQYPEALECLDRALSLRPGDAKALNNRFQCLRAMRRNEEAAEAMAGLMAIAPDWDYAAGNLLHARAHCCRWVDDEAVRRRLVEDALAGRKADLPLSFLAVTDSAAAQLACARTWVDDKFPAIQAAVPPVPRRPRDRIRVAYVSADFREHPVSYLMAGVFERHDRSRFEITGISLAPDDGSPAGRRVRQGLGHVVDVYGQSDAEIAAVLRNREIDIAVDLMGHTFGSRTGVFAMRPAPVQVNYLGYPGTMGAPYIDYILADRIVIPAERRSFYSEQVVYLPDCFQANDDRRRIADRRFSRGELGLPEAGFVFCCFNNSYKINPAVFARWMALLRSVEGSVLWLFAEGSATAKNLRAEASRLQVDPGRLVFAGRVPYAEHLARLQVADLFLDTWPFNAGTTASDALWAGVPVLTCPGEAFAARMAASLVTAVGLPELVAGSVEDYVRIALKLASEPATLAALRSRLWVLRTQSPLFDTARFCRNLEEAYRRMCERNRQGLKPDVIEVAAQTA
jgi:predicted O-linked N-acetylglucosamine transferase (SPINDLY family)